MRVGLIWAEAHSGAIGEHGGMPWHVPEDLAHFKTETLGSPVIMGRKTWESLPERFRPLPGRENVVVTRDPEYNAVGATIVHSLEAALEGVTSRDAMVWVMGGGELFRSAMPIATDLSVTRLEKDVPGADTFAPEIGPEWQLTKSSDQAISSGGLAYSFEHYQRASDTLDR